MSVGRGDLKVTMQSVIFAVSIAFISGCSALPFGGRGLEAAIEGRRQEQPPVVEQPPAEVEPVSCQCNVYCN